MTSKNKKEAVIIAGANGSGKTTFAHKFLDVTKYEFLNADEFAKALSPKNPLKARIAAGKKVIKSIDKFIEEERSFILESTLSGNFLEKHINKLKKYDYNIRLVFIYLTSTELCKNRIKSRVLQGGHDVPDEDVVRRFNRGLVKFWYLYRTMVDYYSIYFNNEFYDFKQVAQGKKKNVEVLIQPLFDEFIGAIEENSDE